MKLFVIVCLFFLSQNVYSQVEKKLPFFYSYEQFQSYFSREKDEPIYPQLKVSNNELNSILGTVAMYPKFAKYKFIPQNVEVLVSFDTNGVITGTNIKYPGFDLFDTNATKLILATKLYWSPALSKGKAIPITLTIPVRFQMRPDSGQNVLYFLVTIFATEMIAKKDSTNTFPARLDYSDNHPPLEKKGKKASPYEQVKFVLKGVHKDLPTYSSFSGCFGTVRLGFNLDSKGVITNPQIIHAVCKSLNDEAMKDLKETAGKWLPARENGILIDSYVEFDFSYDEYGDYSFVNWTVSRLAYAAMEDAYEYLKNKKYDKALLSFKAASNYYLDDIELLFRLALVRLYTGQLEDGCNDLSKIKSIAIDTSYPSTVKEKDVDALMKESCGGE